ncbi:hypothetical protein TRV_00010 [Trichophyton verrucosum HKI 0517]|uniref:Prefoldin subunit 2 n=1 Tax=Trichophyton verrucosum (strain HKI 0517) TaxID=663202 RepID=D4CYX3_TRIVH|nr:uncharacterized protein TRV_00010 [Trichophyton verrucosum HKI 0517]EFE45196.1 hypothetical protein TRV_00010 [Trichophyton verrucosum HKI 0517]
MAAQVDPKRQQDAVLQLQDHAAPARTEDRRHRDRSRRTQVLTRTNPNTCSAYSSTAHPRHTDTLTPSRLVIESLQPLPLDRKCFRMINGVLVERTVKDVIPSLKTNADGLKQVLDELMKQYKSKQDEMDNWKKKNHIQVVQQ